MNATSAPTAAVAAPAPADPREANYVRNLACLTAVEMGWGFAMMFGFSASFMQLVLKDLGASDAVIGVLAAQWGIGTLPMVLSGYWTGHLRRKKAVVIWGHYLCVLPAIGLAAALSLVTSNAAKIWCVVAAQYAFSIGVCLLMPVWLTFMGKIMPPSKIGAGFGITFSLQTLTGAGAAWIASRILASNPSATATCVAITAAVMLAGNAFFFPVRETETAADPRHDSFRQFLRSLLGELRTNRNLRMFLVVEVLFSVQFAIMGFYAARAKAFGGDAATGATLSSILGVCQGLSALLAGFLTDRVGAKRVLAAGRLFIVVAAAIAWQADSVRDLQFAAAAIGLYFGARSTAAFATFRQVVGREEATSAYGLFGLFVAPFSAGLPLLGGWLLGRGLPPTTFFAATGAVALVSVAVLVFGVRLKRLPA